MTTLHIEDAEVTAKEQKIKEDTDGIKEVHVVTIETERYKLHLIDKEGEPPFTVKEKLSIKFGSEQTQLNT